MRRRIIFLFCFGSYLLSFVSSGVRTGEEALVSLPKFTLMILHSMVVRRVVAVAVVEVVAEALAVLVKMVVVVEGSRTTPMSL